MDEFNRTYCDGLFNADSGELDREKSQYFMRRLGQVYADTSWLGLGYKSSNTFCITPTMMGTDDSGDVDCRTPYLQKTSYAPAKICHTEMVDVLNYLMTFNLTKELADNLFPNQSFDNGLITEGDLQKITLVRS